MVNVTCANHPERAAVESCEVCGKPLCAYCLYYTDDGQRLCQTHAEQARLSGANIHAPGEYAEGLIPSQIAASRPQVVQAAGYEGDTVDLMALVALILGIVSVMMCIPPGICLVGPVGLILSVLALIGAKNARNPARTRTLATVGATLSGLWLVILLACVFAYFTQAATLFTVNSSVINAGNIPVTVIVPGMIRPAITPTFTPSETLSATVSATP
ncbi:MAG: hypothetical protein ABI947_29085 [Chloroflexota bacterium]